MNIARVLNTEHLRSIHHPDKPKNNMGERAYACISNPLFFVTLDGEKITTNEWFVNLNGELIYNIKKNKWVNMAMYEKNESYITKDIYYFQEAK